MDGHHLPSNNVDDRFPTFSANGNGPPTTDSAYHTTAIDPNLQSLDNQDPFPSRFPLESGHAQSLPLAPFSQSTTQLRYRDAENQHPRTLQTQNQMMSNGRFNLLASTQPVPAHAFPQQPMLAVQQDNGLVGDASEDSPGRTERKINSSLIGFKRIRDPPDLDAWRERLFAVDKIVYMTEQEFETYFPHVDNVYSHRATANHKKKPFVSYYWDCRLKGRPAGTPKSTDPNKKKRKRLARPRDLCDFKIKVTEYFPGANQLMKAQRQDGNEGDGDSFFDADDSFVGTSQSFSVLQPSAADDPNLPGANGEKYYTIERVIGPKANASGEGPQPALGPTGGHAHTLEESDRIKKNSVIREFAAEERANKKIQNKKTYSHKATGAAFATVRRRSREREIQLFGSCFCPFVQRVWIALELKGIDYQYIEVDPYMKPRALTEISPKGLIPAIRNGNWSCHESTVLLEYLEDISPDPSLNPGTPEQRAHTRLWADHVNRHLVPSFYRLLQAQTSDAQATAAAELKDFLEPLIDAADPEGPFFIGKDISAVDVHFAPYMLRFRRVLSPYRSWPAPEEGSRWKKWVDAIEGNESVKATISGDEVYLDSYERYAENRPGTSQVADAINSGRGLP